MSIDTFNKFFVGVQGDKVTFLKPVPQQLSKEDAMLLAAYIVCIAEAIQGDANFPDTLEAIQNT